MHPVATYDERERRRYRWCPSCRELWAATRFGATCPLCDGRTLAYVGRSPYDESVTDRRREPALKRGVELVETALMTSVSAGLEHLRHRVL